MTSPKHHYRRRGVALIIVLSFVILVTVVIVALFSRAAANRQIAAASSNQAKADVLAKSALEVIIGDLKQEMAAGSTVDIDTGSNGLIMTPLSNVTAVPCVTVSGTTRPNLLKMSTSGVAFFSGTAAYTNPAYNSPRLRASAAPTTGASANGRSILVSRWNAPQLMTSAPAPDWIFVTRRGNVGERVAGPQPIPYASADIAELKNPSSEHYAIGRFAYMIYDEGGLLDINVAGNLLPDDINGNVKRGRLHQADLRGITGITDPGPILDWRASVTGADGRDHSGGLFDPRRDFISVLTTGTAGDPDFATDQTFVSRQDLIAYSKKYPSQIPTAALKYLSTFSREKNEPSWSPSPLSQAGITLPGYKYADVADDVNAFNRNLPKVRDAEGKPLIKQRFPLSRIALIATKATKVQDYFGLTIQPGTETWIYNHGIPNGIYTLEQVREHGGGREPDFFELLKAVILRGSLGKIPGEDIPSTPSSRAYTTDVQAIDAQVFQIGANIIDQYDADNYPTDIYCALTNSGINDPSNRFFGVENLPYLTRLYAAAYPKTSAFATVSGWFLPQLWNPYQNKNNTGSGPTNLRIRAMGDARMVIKEPSNNDVPVARSYSTGPISLVPPDPLNAAGTVNFSYTPDSFRNPELLVTDSSPGGVPLSDPPDSDLVGFHVGDATGSASPAVGTKYEFRPGASDLATSVLTFILEYEGETPGQWRPYSIWSGLKGTASPLVVERPVVTGTIPVAWADPMPAAAKAAQSKGHYVKVDPRTDRLGVAFADGSTAMATQAINNATTYADADGVTRPVDGVDGGYPTAFGPTDPRRPVVLNRPFRSVGELGYAFRDQPFKTLDFSSLKSADAGLLDVFGIDDNELIAGRFNPNTRNPEVLKAMLMNAGTDEANKDAVLTDAQAQTIATAIVNATKTNPIKDRAELVTRIGAAIEGAVPAAIRNNKTQREAVVRALAEASNTRTWNLMIDVIAQTGRFPPRASGNLTGDFVVEGERRYWLHLAIDRYTGQVVSRQLESVTE